MADDKVLIEIITAANMAGVEQAKRIELAFRLSCGRTPHTDEFSACTQFVATQRTLYANEKDAEQRVWTDFCQMIQAGNAFLYVE